MYLISWSHLENTRENLPWLDSLQIWQAMKIHSILDQSETNMAKYENATSCQPTRIFLQEGAGFEVEKNPPAEKLKYGKT